VKATGVRCSALFARLYNVPEEHVLVTPYGAAFAFKAALPRWCRRAISATRTFMAVSGMPLCRTSICPFESECCPCLPV